MTGKRWWFFGTCPKTGKVTMIAEASRKLGESHARVLAHLLADDTRLRVTAYAPTGKGPLPNPTLVAHGLARAATWHIVTESNEPLADLYYNLSKKPVAMRIARLIANLTGGAVKLLDNAELMPKLLTHPRSFVAPNPATARQLEPVIGETWHTYAGERAQIKAVTPGAVVVYWTAGGNREWLDPREFAARFKAPVTRKPNPIPRGVDPRSIRTVGRGAKRLLIGCSKGSYQPRKARCRVGTRAVNPSRSSAAKGRRRMKRLKTLAPRRLYRAQAAGRRDKSGRFLSDTIRRGLAHTATPAELAYRSPNPKGPIAGPFKVGERVELHPATSEWMQGDRYGVVVGYGRSREFIDSFTKEKFMARPVKVKLDKSGRVRRFHPDNVTAINPRRRRNPGDYVPVAEAAKQLRVALKRHFPTVKFSVRSKSYSGGASITVSYTNGPRSSDVDLIAQRFAGADFDAMTDLKSSRDSLLVGPDGTLRSVRYGSDYVFVNRDLSPTLQAAVIAQLGATWNEDQWAKMPDYEKERMARRGVSAIAIPDHEPESLTARRAVEAFFHPESAEGRTPNPKGRNPRGRAPAIGSYWTRLAYPQHLVRVVSASGGGSGMVSYDVVTGHGAVMGSSRIPVNEFLAKHAPFEAASPYRKTLPNPKDPLERRYKSEKAFRTALAKFTASGELVDWYGDDYGWVIRLRRIVPSGRRTPNPKGRRPSAQQASEHARGVKTFKKWHAFAPHRTSRVRAPGRIPRTMVRLGELEALVYRSDKWAGGPDNPRGKQLLYEHTTQRPRPVLATDPDGRDFFIVGGKMRVTADGLVH